MKFGLLPSSLIDLVALVSGMMPSPVVKSFWGYAMGRVVLAGTRLGVFDCLAQGPKTAAEVASETGCDPLAMETLLNALNGFGLLKRRKGYYSLTKTSTKWLTKGSPTTMVDAVRFIGVVAQEFERLEDVVRSGKVVPFHDPRKPDSFWNSYLKGLATFARYGAKEIVRRVRFDQPPKRMLDVGGGHGVYTMNFLKKYPALTGEIIDLPEAVRVGKEIVKDEGFSNRVRFIEGDMLKLKWGGGYDLVLLFNVIHAVGIDEAEILIKKARQALNPNGRLVILDSEHIGGDKDLSLTSGLNELLFFVINGTRVYPEAKIRGWLKENGFNYIKKKKLLSMPVAMIMIAS